MKKLVKFIVVPMMCLAANFASAANIKDYPTVAVMDFGNKAITSRGLRGHDMTMATEYAIYQLSACGWFDLIDYEQLSTIAKMHSINMSGMVDSSSAVQMGKISGAQFMVIGNVTGLTTKENVAGLRAHNAKLNNAQHVVNANVTVRIVDVETGRIVAAGIGKGSSTSTMTEVGFTKYRTKRNVRAENIGNTVINDVKDELVTRNTKQNTSTQDSDNRSISTNQNSNYNRSDRANSTDVNVNSGSSEFQKNGGTNSGSFYVDEANQSGTANSEYNNRGFEEEVIDGRRNTNESIRDRESSSASSDAISRQTGTSASSLDNDWKKGGSSLNTSGGPAEGVVWGKGQDMTWDMTVYNDNSDYHMGYVGGESHTKAKNDYEDIQTDNRRAQANRSRDYDKNATDRLNITDSKVDNRKITSKSDYDNNQSSSGVSGSFTDYDDQGRSQFRNQNVNIKNSDFDSNISQNQNSQYNNSGDRSHSYSDDYQDAIGSKANNSTSVSTNNQYVTYDKEAENYSIVIGTVEVSDVQVRNAISKAVRDAIYGNTGIMTTLNNGKKLKIKTGF